ncbi:MAG TPA: glycerol-3-phosphate 1-O-acyltransferase PlsY [Caulobacteraceae bacterium]|jgi:glycerol-3-phosphate acyltransferase PlsY
MIHAHVSTATVIVSVLGGYLLGSIPTGLIATRLGGAGDIRSIGSGNIGATNVLRTGRRDLAMITLAGDALKGAIAVLIFAALWGPVAAAFAGGAAFVGHLFPVWLRFHGGKGVATFFGIMIAIAWPAGLAAGAIWIVVAAIFRYSSLAGLVAAALSPVLVGLLRGWGLPSFWLAVFMAVLIFVRHRENLERLIEGKESRIDLSATTT